MLFCLQCFWQRPAEVSDLSGCTGGMAAFFSMTAMKKPPVSPWCGRIRMQRCRGRLAEALSGNMLTDKLLPLLACRAQLNRCEDLQEQFKSGSSMSHSQVLSFSFPLLGGPGLAF